MIQCGICLEDYQEGDLELHREMCVVRLMFRCSICDEDYVSKEGLWNHLDLHEIADESKELHYQEITAKYKLHQCVPCNDQRAYSESSYWKHVHDIHDGFFLRCSDCGENFRSEKLKNDHSSSHCKAGNQTVASDLSTLGEEQVPIVVDDVTSDAELPSRFACDICGITFSTKGLHLRHMRSKYSCLEGRLKKCPHCRRNFQINEYQVHFSLCAKKKFSCELCPLKFDVSRYLKIHMRSFHRDKRVLNNEKQRSEPETLVSISNSSSSSNVVEHTDIGMDKDIADNSVQPLVESQSSTSSSTKCDQCGKECTTAIILRRHFRQSHLPIKCSICGITFLGSSKVRYHKIMKHMKPKYECLKCSKKFHSIEDYKRHSNECDSVQSDSSSYKGASELILKEKNDPKLTPENPSSEPSRTKCPYCGIEVSGAITLARHILVHHDSASCTKCSYCGMEESNAVTLARHILMHHDPVACDFCGITLTSLSQAQHHKKTMHRESKLKCPYCSMQFYYEMRLQNHVSKCENKKVHCDFCGKMFKSASGVAEHKRKSCCGNKRSKKQDLTNAETSPCDEGESSTEMEKTTQPLVESDLSQTKCYYCGEELSSPGCLNHHLKVCHELTKCDICGVTIFGISATNNHKIKCHQEPKHKCPTCGKKFHFKIDFHAHYSACEHKRYLCKLCGRTFPQLYLFNRHYKKSHPDERSFKIFEIVQERKQVPNNDLQMDIAAEETAILAPDDQVQPTVNPSSKADDSNSRPNEHSLANMTDDDLMDSQGIDKESPMVSVAPLNGSSEEQVVSEQTSQSRVGNLSNHPYSCNICGITLQRRSQVTYHIQTRHAEEKFQCPHCSKTFPLKSRLKRHASRCVDLKYACELCDQKFYLRSRLESHKNTIHHGSRTLRNAIIEGADRNEEQMQHSIEKIDEVQGMVNCIVCGITFVSTEELMKHKLTCLNAKKHDHDEKETQTNSTIVPQGENVELELEIKVEETMLQEQEYQVPNEDPRRSSVTALVSAQQHEVCQHAHGAKSKDNEADDAKDLENGVKVKEENLEDEVEILTEHQSPTESGGDQSCPCLTCGLAFGSIRKMRYHMLVCHTEPRFKCARCQKLFHLGSMLRSHEKSCSELICNKCGVKFTSRYQLKGHKKHVHDG